MKFNKSAMGLAALLLGAISGFVYGISEEAVEKRIKLLLAFSGFRELPYSSRREVWSADPSSKSINLEIWNKTDKPCWVSQAHYDTTSAFIGRPETISMRYIGVFTKIEPATKEDATKKKKLFTAIVDTAKSTALLIKCGAQNEPDIYLFRPGKDIYVALNPDGKLGPQIGPLKGFRGITESGRSLKNNVKKDDIESIKSK